MRFAEIQAFAAHFSIERGQCTSAPFAGFTTVNDDVGIGAEQLEATFAREQKVGAINLWIGLRIEGAAADDACGL